MKSVRKKQPAALLLAAMLALLPSCGNSAQKKSEEKSQEPTLFDTYVSNTVVATGNNKTIDSAEHVTYRAWLPVEAAGSFEYCFYFSNAVDSTWEDGSTYAYADQGNGKGFNYVNEIPLPQLFGCKREVKTRIVTLGDSVTQGCQTSDNAYQFWVAQTLDQLGTEDYSLWNLGLGYARATDCAAGGDWLNRAVAGADLITVAFGTNDIISGPYGGSGHATAAEIEDAVRTITKKCTDSGVQTIVWNSPPFDLSVELEPIRTEYNATVASIAADCGAQFFDAASLLADPTDASKTVYGQHPNDEGGTVLATALAEKIREMKNK